MTKISLEDHFDGLKLIFISLGPLVQILASEPQECGEILSSSIQRGAFDHFSDGQKNLTMFFLADASHIGLRMEK